LSAARNAVDSAVTPGAARASDGGAVGHATDAAEDGVDLSLIRWMLSLTPSERLAALQGFVDSALSLRDGADLPKEQLGRDKDRASLAVLRQTLALRGIPGGAGR
jgi:hypothetical protein